VVSDRPLVTVHVFGLVAQFTASVLQLNRFSPFEVGDQSVIRGLVDRESYDSTMSGRSPAQTFGYCSARMAASSTTGSRVTGPIATTSARRIVPLNSNGAV
jgi:hypothetical protein